MNDDSSGSLRTQQRHAPRGRHRAPRSKGTWLKSVLWLGIAACLLASVLFLANQDDRSTKASALEFSADDTAGDAIKTGNIFEDSLIDPRLILGTEMPVIYGVDLEEVYTDESLEGADRPDINFDVLPEEVKLEILRYSNDAQEPFVVGSQGPQILIYHTHTREAYNQTDVDVYSEIGEWQTLEQSHSVVAVGEVLKAELESYGFTVLHDTTDHVPPKQNTAYSRSLQTMLEYQQQYPSLKVFIDLHRDAYGDIEAGSQDFVTIDGKECARMMFVVGTGENYEGDEKPNYETNYKLAQAVTNELEDICEGFMRPIRVKPGGIINRYRTCACSSRWGITPTRWSRRKTRSHILRWHSHMCWSRAVHRTQLRLLKRILSGGRYFFRSACSVSSSSAVISRLGIMKA